jgi:hypothetical protein
VPVTVHLAHLAVSPTYHWRLTATSAAGTTTTTDQTFAYPSSPASESCPNAQLREESNSLALPDCRAYEMVTPPNKNGALIGALFQHNILPRIASDGQRVIAPAIQCFDSPESCTANRYSEGDPYEFTRTPTGWTTSTLAPPAAEYESSSWFSVNANEGTALFTAPSAPESVVDDFLVRGEHGSLTNVGPVGEHETADNELPNWRVINEGNVIATADLSDFVYEARASVWSFDTGASTGQAGALYEYAPGTTGTPLMVGVTGGYENGENHNLVSACGTRMGQGHGASPRGFDGSLSEDGRIVYFTAEASAPGRSCLPVNELYARIDGEDLEPGFARAVPVSEDPPAATCQTTSCKEDTTIPGDFRNGYFEGASSDGSEVVFTDTQQLTDGANEDSGSAANGGCHKLAPSGGGCNLYLSQCPHCEALSEAEEEEHGARSLIDVSEDAAGGQVAGGPRVQGVLAISSDGSHVYFVAKGVLTGAEENANHEHAENEAQNLYLYAEGHRTFVARLSSRKEGFHELVDENEWNDTNLIANVTPEGRFLVFTSHRALTADDTRGEGPAQVYEYDSQLGSLTRISIGEDGYNDDGNSGVGNAQIVEAGLPAASDGSVPYRMDPTMSNDGSYVFFQSPVALAPGALDDVAAPDEPGSPSLDGGLVQNVYEYHDGRVSLISDGRDVTDTGGIGLQDIISPVELLGSDESGANVFFATFSPLVPQDRDTQRDIYDARSNECVNVRGEEGTPSEGSCVAGEHLELSGLPAPVSSSSCEEACHPAGSGSVAEGVPASESFAGAGNLVPPAPAAAAVVKPKSAAQVRAEKLAKALKTCRKDKKAKRTSCEKRARRAYGAAAKAKKKVVSR